MRVVTRTLLFLTLMIPAAFVASAAKKPAAKAPPKLTEQEKEALKTPLQQVVSAEQEFSKLAGRTSVRQAFLTNLSADAVVFRPLPQNGHDLWEARQPNKASLAWGPAYAEVAASGDFGITTGPSEYTPASDSTAVETSYGDFLSVWRRTKDGWRVVLDCGVSHAKTESGLAGLAFTPGPEHPAGAAPPMEAGVLRSFDLSFGRMATSFNPGRAVVFWTTDDLRYLREGEAPRFGSDARNAMSGPPRRSAWTTMDTGIAASGDLGYTYGVRVDSSDVASKAPDSTVFVHVWRRATPTQWKMSAVVDHLIKRE